MGLHQTIEVEDILRFTSWILRVAVCAVVFSSVPSLALPETLGEWRSSEEAVLPLMLAANSDSVGRWTRRIYTRAVPPASIEVNLMEGSGPGPLRVPEAVESYRGAIEGQPEYRVLEVAGHRAVLERYPYLPLALAVSISPDVVLTLESRSAGEKELIELAERIIEYEAEVSGGRRHPPELQSEE